VQTPFPALRPDGLGRRKQSRSPSVFVPIPNRVIPDRSPAARHCRHLRRFPLYHWIRFLLNREVITSWAAPPDGNGDAASFRGRKRGRTERDGNGDAASFITRPPHYDPTRGKSEPRPPTAALFATQAVCGQILTHDSWSVLPSNLDRRPNRHHSEERIRTPRPTRDDPRHARLVQRQHQLPAPFSRRDPQKPSANGAAQCHPTNQQNQPPQPTPPKPSHPGHPAPRGLAPLPTAKVERPKRSETVPVPLGTTPPLSISLTRVTFQDKTRQPPTRPSEFTTSPRLHARRHLPELSRQRHAPRRLRGRHRSTRNPSHASTGVTDRDKARHWQMLTTARTTESPTPHRPPRPKSVKYVSKARHPPNRPIRIHPPTHRLLASNS